DVTSELLIPENAGERFGSSEWIMWTIVFLLRTRIDPATTLVAQAVMPFSDLKNSPETAVEAFPTETQPRGFALFIKDASLTAYWAGWLTKHWPPVVELFTQNKEFEAMAFGLDRGHFGDSHALTLISLWASLENAFLQGNTSELSFRLSS